MLPGISLLFSYATIIAKQEDLCTGIAFICDDKTERRETSNGDLREWARHFRVPETRLSAKPFLWKSV